MRTRRSLIFGLVALNLFLLAAMVVLSYDLPQAYAQRSGGGGGKYAAVTAEYTKGTDALFLLHTGRRVLTVLIPDQSGLMSVGGSRELSADLGQE